MKAPEPLGCSTIASVNDALSEDNERASQMFQCERDRTRLVLTGSESKSISTYRCAFGVCVKDENTTCREQSFEGASPVSVNHGFTYFLNDPVRLDSEEALYIADVVLNENIVDELLVLD